MTTGLATETMAKSHENPKRDDVAVKVDARVIADAKIAAAFEGVSLAEFLTETLRPIVAKKLDEAIARRSRGNSPPKSKPSK